MSRQQFLDLAESGLRMPIAADLVLHQHADPTGVKHDGARLGAVVAETARHFRTPLAVPLMDLEIEKRQLLACLGMPTAEAEIFHFTTCPEDDVFARLNARLAGPLTPRLQAQVDGVAYVATHTDLLPIGMCIGPFSLMSKLVVDPITPVAMAGAGVTAEDDDEVRLVERVLELGMKVILRSLSAQVQAGAQAIFIAEPAANLFYFSPNQLEDGADTFNQYVVQYHRIIKGMLDEWGVDLIFHCCGELTDYMVRQFGGLHPVLLSLGSSRKLWEDTRQVPRDVVLFGNLPSKQFYADSLITRAGVEALSEEITAKMREIGHPFILGTECDVLSVPGCEQVIWEKVEVLMNPASAAEPVLLAR